MRADWTVAKSQVQHGGKLSDFQVPVFLNGDGDRSHNVGSPLLLFCVGVALIKGQFSLFHSLDDLVYLADQKGIVPICSVNQWFDVFSAFPGLGKRGDEIPGFHHSANRRG